MQYFGTTPQNQLYYANAMYLHIKCSVPVPFNVSAGLVKGRASSP